MSAGEYKPLAAIRDQQVDIVRTSDSAILCTVKAGPKTQIHSVKLEISTSSGIPVREQTLMWGDYKYKDAETVGIHFFKDLHPGEVPSLSFIQLSPEQAEFEEGRYRAFEAIQSGHKLSQLEERFRADPEVALLAVEHTNASELQHAADSVKSDSATMLEALRIHGACMYYVAESLWNDRDFILGAVQIDGMLLGQKMVPESWRSDTEVVMYACEQNGYALQLASPELKNNRAVVIAAVTQRGTALMYASEDLQSDYYVVLDAVQNNRMAIVHAKNGLREDEDLRAAAGQGPSEHWADHEKVDKIKKKFHKLDKNGDGFLSYEELVTLLRKGNPDMEDEDIKLLYDEMNVHHDGRVDFHEFCDWIFRLDC